MEGPYVDALTNACQQFTKKQELSTLLAYTDTGVHSFAIPVVPFEETIDTDLPYTINRLLFVLRNPLAYTRQPVPAASGSHYLNSLRDSGLALQVIRQARLPVSLLGESEEHMLGNDEHPIIIRQPFLVVPGADRTFLDMWERRNRTYSRDFFFGLERKISEEKYRKLVA